MLFKLKNFDDNTIEKAKTLYTLEVEAGITKLQLDNRPRKYTATSGLEFGDEISDDEVNI